MLYQYNMKFLVGSLMVTKVTVTSKGLSGVIVSKCWGYCLTMLSIDGFELSDSSDSEEEDAGESIAILETSLYTVNSCKAFMKPSFMALS